MKARRVLSLAALGLLLGMNGQLPFCNQNKLDPDSGNLHRLSDIVVVRPPANDAPPPSCVGVTCPIQTGGGEGEACLDGGLCNEGLFCSAGTCTEIPRTYVVVANPEIEQLRIYDAYRRDFVRAPNVFFPLSIQTGPSSRRLAVASDDQTRVYALDGVDDRVLTVRTVAEGDQPAFTRVGQGARTARAPADLAVVWRGEGDVLAFVSVPDAGAVQVLLLDPGTGDADEIAFLDLGADSRPAHLAASPDGDAVIVTDAALPSVAVLRTDTLALDRRIDVGGPTLGVSTGRVDPGDGMGPVALVLRRDAPAVAALRLLREENREDRYALLGIAEVPEVMEVAWIPDQDLPLAETDPSVCCATLEEREEVSLAWAFIVGASGTGYYLKLDGRRTGDLEGERGLVRLVDRDPEGPGFASPTGLSDINTATDVWFPTDEASERPRIAFVDEDTYGSPPTFPHWPEGMTVSLEWEGSPPGGANRSSSVMNNLLVVASDGSGQTLAQRDLGPGDWVHLDTHDRPSTTCPSAGFIERSIDSLMGNTLDVGGFDDDELGCLLTGGPIRTTFLVRDAYTVHRSDTGYLGRLELEVTPYEPALPSDFPEPAYATSVDGLRLRIGWEGPAPGRGSEIIIPLGQNVDPVTLRFSQLPNADNSGTGFDLFGRVPTGIAGAETWLQPIDNTQPPRLVRRLFLAIGASEGNVHGRILELNETETNLAFVNADNR